MSLSNKDFEKSVFTYLISNVDWHCDLLPKKLCVFGWHIYASELTDVLISENSSEAVVIVGYCVDSQAAVAREDVAKYLLNSKGDSLANVLSRFGGKYMVFHYNNHIVNVYTDATATLPVYYSCDGDFILFSSHEIFIASYTNDSVSQQALSLIKKGDSSKTLPYMMSRYENIYSLLPNHCFSTDKKCAQRLACTHQDSVEYTAEKAAEITLPLIMNTASALVLDYVTKCPLTGGYDSRVVFGVLHSLLGNKFHVYTMKHSMNDDHSDLVVPQKICDDYKCDYNTLNDSVADKDMIDKCDAIFGKGLYSSDTLNIVATLAPLYKKNSCLVNGDIVGQIGKSSLHRSVRNCFMGPAYYQSKIHNTSRIAYKHIKNWYKSAKKSCPTTVCERFNEEIRLGRWAADENSMYSLFGINVVNIFNCNDIIKVWQNVPRKHRKLSALHIELIKLLDDKLLDYGFSASTSKLEKIARKNDIFFYIATFAKFAIQIVNNLK